MGRLDGKVAFITGAGRGQGRSHAVRMAEEGADIIGVDLCGPVETVPYPLSNPSDLEETARLVRETGRAMLAAHADVRDFEALSDAAAAGVERFGGIDIALANAGILSFAPAHEMSGQAWADMLDIHLTGSWHTAKAVIPHMLPMKSGAIIITSSAAGFLGVQNLAHYCAAKHGVIGLMRALAVELGPSNIRVNTIHPTNVATDMVLNDAVYKAFRPDLESPGIDDIRDLLSGGQVLPIPWIEALDVSNAIVFLASDEARYITGMTMQVDGGVTVR